MHKKSSTLKLIRQKGQFDYYLLIITLIFSFFGLLMIFEASNFIAFNDFGDKFYYVKEQTAWLFFGLICLVTCSFIPYKKFYFCSFPLLIATIIVLIVVFVPGLGVKALGASRRINLGTINFQPSELAKLSIIFYLSAWFAHKENKRLAAFLLVLGLIVGLVVIQPALGTALIISSIALVIYFLSGAPLWHFLMLIPAGVVSIIFLILTSSYRLKRLTTFFDPNIDPLGASYHIRQILLSLGSGGLWGLGLGASKQKYQYLPEATTDSIFAIIGEEFGFIGSTVFLVLVVFFLYRLLKIAQKAPDRYSFLLASGVFMLFASQIIINLGANLALFPLTGVPLPFFSYGGSNLIISLTAVGVALNISRWSISKRG